MNMFKKKKEPEMFFARLDDDTTMSNLETVKFKCPNPECGNTWGARVYSFHILKTDLVCRVCGTDVSFTTRMENRK